MLQAILHASEVLTGEGIRAKDGRKVGDPDIGSIPDGAVVYSTRRGQGRDSPHQIEWVGKTSDLPKKYKSARKKDLKGERAIIPGLVDCHTHLIFAGDRSEEFAQRCAGVSYEEIAKKGGGIRTTVESTRKATPKQLERLAMQRLNEAYSYGIRTLEIKSGYGLSHESEIKVLELIPRLRRLFPDMTLTSTYLGAHAFPADQSREEYLRQMLEQTLPEVAKRSLADSCDVFIDRGYYTVDEGRKILSRARDLGLKIKVHADELANTESAKFAAEMGALSADHLLQVSDTGIKALAQSNTVAVLLPGTAFYLKAAYAPARKLIDAGASVALSTDFNPGTCMTLSLPVIMTLSALYLGMSRAEIFAGVTYNAAKALGLEKSKGSLAPGLDADVVILPFARFEEMYYRFAWRPEIQSLKGR